MNTPKWYDEPREKGPSTMDLGEWPKFSLKERAARWAELRRKMNFHKIDVLLIYGTDAGYGRGLNCLRYVTQYADAHGAWAIFPLVGECTVFSAPKHMAMPVNPYLVRQDWVTDLRPGAAPSEIVEELKKRGYEKARIGVVSCESTMVSTDPLPYVGFAAILKGLPDADFVDANGLILDMRRIKSEEEISMLTKAGEIAQKKMQAMIDSLKIGNTEADMYAEMIATDIRNGAEPLNFLLLGSANVFDDDPGYKGLLHGPSPAAAPLTRKFRDGDLVICEYHTRYCGYMAGVEFSCFLGTPPKELVEIYDAAMEARAAALKTLKPGVTCKELWEAMRKPVTDRDFDYTELGFHGHGLGSPEFPGLVYRPEDDPAATIIADIPFDKDMVICLNIDIHNPNWRKDVGVMFGTMLLVTEDGCKELVTLPDHFICNEV